MSKKRCDFSGWATKNNIRCSDGRIIRNGAFSLDNGKRVPLVWNHNHSDVEYVLGHAELEERPEGIYAYCSFNNTKKGQAAKEVVNNGDVVALSIFAGELKERSKNVLHGAIKEVSLVLAGANKGAIIDAVMVHGDMSEDSAEIRFVGYGDIMIHSDDEEDMFDEYEEDMFDEYEDDDEYFEHSDDENDETVSDVMNTLNEKQRKAVAIIIDQILSDSKEGSISHADDSQNDDETVEDVINTLSEKQRKVVAFLIDQVSKQKNGGNEMKHNVFDGTEDYGRECISHSDFVEIFKVGRQMGSLKSAFDQAIEEGVIAHSDEGEYGINNLDYLFPNYKSVNPTPEFIKRDMGWVDGVINGAHRTPFKKVKSIFADITEDEARARGYIKGKYKKEEVFTLLKRTTDPQTIYKKQKLDKDDLEDLEDNFNVLPWLKEEMQMMLKEEIARAILIGDGRSTASDDKIKETNIRPIYNDEDLFTVKIPVNVAANATSEDIAKALIKAMIKARKFYKGSGNPNFYTTEDYLTDSLLIENSIGERIYKSEAEVATAMRVKSIIPVEPMENKTISITSEGVSTSYPLIGIEVNMGDYNIGSKNNGKTDFFEDFDIDFNQQKYLYETRMSGALVKPYSAISYYLVKANS